MYPPLPLPMITKSNLLSSATLSPLSTLGLMLTLVPLRASLHSGTSGAHPSILKLSTTLGSVLLVSDVKLV